MRRLAKRVIRSIGDTTTVARIELLVQNVGGLFMDVPAVCYRLINSAGNEKRFDYFICRGYLRPGKWRAKSVANEIWTYYQSRGVNSSVIDSLA